MFRLNELEFKATEQPVLLRAHNEAGKLHGGPTYSAHELETLYSLPRCTETDEGSGLKEIRHLITESGEHRFAREGTPSRNIPHHKEMPRSVGAGCLFACNMLVNSQSEILKFNNKSSNYRPDGNLIQFGFISLRLLTLNHPGIKMGATIEIEIINRDHSKKVDNIRSYVITRDAFNTLADEMIAHYMKLDTFRDTDGKFIFAYDDAKVNQLKATYPVVVSQATQLSPFLRMAGAQTHAPRPGIFGAFNFSSMSVPHSEQKNAPARPTQPTSAPQISSSLFHDFLNSSLIASKPPGELITPSNFPSTPTSPNKRKHSFMTPPPASKKEEAKAESSGDTSPNIAPPSSPLFFSSDESPTTPPSRRTKLDPEVLKEIFQKANGLMP